MADGAVSERKKARFKDELKSRYKLLYSAVQPVQCSGRKHYFVNELFQEIGVECLNTTRYPHRGILWERLESYKSILNDSRSKSSKRVIEAPQGYGKSTLALQFAFDWCNKVGNSPIGDIDIFIVVQLKKVGHVTSFPKLVKEIYFPKDSKITTEDIHNILVSSKSVMLMVDSGSDSIDTYIQHGSDLHLIMKGEMYSHFEVILMTRSLSIDIEPSVKRLKLIGFDKKAQERYISTSLHDSNHARLEKTKEIMLNNPVLGDFCKIPLLFALFSHLSHGNDNINNFSTLTNFFNEIIKSFHDHFRQHSELTEQFRQIELFQSAHLELNKIAFDRLSEDSNDVQWGLDDLNSLLDQNFVEQYLKTGILQIEEYLKVELDSANEGMLYEKTVRFYYNILTQWYAAHYLVESVHKADELSEDLREEYITDVLENFEPSQVQCLFRFACGINSAAANHIIKYLEVSADREVFSILCKVEQTGSVDGIKKTIQDLFSKEYEVHDSHSKFFQRTYIQLMEIAAREQIRIAALLLSDCFNAVDVYTSDIVLTSLVHLPTLQSLERIWIDQSRIHLTDQEIDGLFLYVSNCPKLQSLVFSNCFLPRSFNESPNLTKLKDREVEGTQTTSAYSSQVYAYAYSAKAKWESELVSYNQMVLYESYVHEVGARQNETPTNRQRVQ